MKLSLDVRVLPDGEKRLMREDGGRGLPVRELVMDRDGRNLTVWLGPIEPGGPECELWELDAVL